MIILLFMMIYFLWKSVNSEIFHEFNEIENLIHLKIRS
jgi:hypothetical protein